ncbi:MAG: CHAD domain-containing protein [Oligoflexia bacterium]|nr:CHAD domain-containing protein [Oligoflexia bacterium]
MRKKVFKRIEKRIDDAEKAVRTLRRGRKSRPVDAEALHVFRIGLRRIEASARILRSVDKKARVEPTLVTIKKLLGSTGGIRDEEVLPEVLPPELSSPEFRDWVHRRGRVLLEREARLSATLDRYLPRGFVLSSQRAILAPFSRIKGKALAKRAKAMIRKDCRRLKSMSSKLEKNKRDERFLHKYRVRSKRLGYVLDLMKPVLPTEIRQLRRLAVLNQTQFGRLHDLDAAIELLEGDARLIPPERDRLSRQLREVRKEFLKRALKCGNRLGKELSFLADSRQL